MSWNKDGDYIYKCNMRLDRLVPFPGYNKEVVIYFNTPLKCFYSLNMVSIVN